MRRNLPTGTVTFLFTDVEGSTRLLHELGAEAYAHALAEHRHLIREACASQGGVEVDTQGDAFFFAFPTAPGALAAASGLAEALANGRVQVRVGVHTGEPTLDPPKYVGLDVHTAARIMASGHGGQVVVSRSTRELLDDSFELSDLGDHRLKDLSGPQRLYQLGSVEFPPLRTLHRTNLPVPATAFLGRDHELSELAAIIKEGVQLLTLAGPGGVGKTRLALQIVAEAAERLSGRRVVGAVRVRPRSGAGHVVGSARARGLGAVGPGASTTRSWTCSRAAAALVCSTTSSIYSPTRQPRSPAFATLGGSTVVVTSRERLQLSGERVYPVDPLDADSATELFSARATALGVDAGEPEPVAELCARLDNLPLAIELAAARATLLPPAELLARLGDRLDGLRGGRDADPRQQTLRATIGWSHDLLDRPERELFASLSVFTGGATLDAVEAVCGSGLDVLASLLDKSLVKRTDERVWMLETIREFAAEQFAASDDAERIARRHLDYYLALAEDVDERRKVGEYELGRIEEERGQECSPRLRCRACTRPRAGARAGREAWPLLEPARPLPRRAAEARSRSCGGCRCSSLRSRPCTQRSWQSRSLAGGSRRRRATWARGSRAREGTRRQKWVRATRSTFSGWSPWTVTPALRSLTLRGVAQGVQSGRGRGRPTRPAAKPRV